MAGRPKRRARLLAEAAQVRESYGLIVPLPVWNEMNVGEKFAVIAKHSLDDAMRFQSIPFDEANLHERNARLAILMAVLKMGARAFEGAERKAEAAELLERLAGTIRGSEVARRVDN